MSDARHSPLPQDRVNENVDQAHRAKDNQREFAEQERYLKSRGEDERPGTDTKVQAERSESDCPAEGGD